MCEEDEGAGDGKGNEQRKRLTSPAARAAEFVRKSIPDQPYPLRRVTPIRPGTASAMAAAPAPERRRASMSISTSAGHLLFLFIG